MALLSGQKHSDYYQGNNLGNYQFTSLETIIAQFQIAYVGEDKIISKVKQQDVNFFAMRALQEFSFDTFFDMFSCFTSSFSFFCTISFRHSILY